MFLGFATLFLGGAPPQSNLPVDHFGLFLPVDHVRFVRARLANLCSGEPQSVAGLLAIEGAQVTCSTQETFRARDCNLRALAIGSDSSWHLLRLSYIASVLGDSLLAASEFERSVAVANTAEARREVGWQLNIRFADASWILPAGFVLDSLSPRGMAEWLGLEDSLSRVKWWRVRAGQLVAKTGKPFAAILQTHFENLTYERGSFHDCHFIATSRPNILAANRHSIPCLAEQDREVREIGLADRYYRLWDQASGAPIGLATFAVPQHDIVAEREESNEIATISIEFRSRGGTNDAWQDTTLSRRYRLDRNHESVGALIGMLKVGRESDVQEWSLCVGQGRSPRFNSDYQDSDLDAFACWRQCNTAGH